MWISLQHFSRGDLEIAVLTSPHGTESVLNPGNNRPENTILEEGGSSEAVDSSRVGGVGRHQGRLDITVARAQNDFS
jgi:subtilisin-like proprotein convertase family protein